MLTGFSSDLPYLFGWFRDSRQRVDGGCVDSRRAPVLSIRRADVGDPRPGVRQWLVIRAVSLEET